MNSFPIKAIDVIYNGHKKNKKNKKNKKIKKYI
jgi:hypothetical protein